MSKSTICHSLTLQSEPSAINGVCRNILSELKESQYNPEDIFAIRLALEESFINALKHGNNMDPSKEIKINYSIGNDKVEITMTDQGDGFDPDSVPDPRRKENLYKASGRGLFLIMAYMDEVKFNKKGNSLYMVKYKKKCFAAKDRVSR